MNVASNDFGMNTTAVNTNYAYASSWRWVRRRAPAFAWEPLFAKWVRSHEAILSRRREAPVPLQTQGYVPAAPRAHLRVGRRRRRRHPCASTALLGLAHPLNLS